MLCAKLFCAQYTVRVYDNIVEDLKNKSDVLGTNLALWSDKGFLENKLIEDYLTDLGISDIRIPGGSWSNEYYWNGNGVRIKDGFDLNKRTSEGIWSIDYRNYMPGFRVEGEGREMAQFHGNLDVLAQHEWIEKLDASSFICFNVGSGNFTMAKEWLKWAKSKNFTISRAEVGNELNGEWELGNKLSNGDKMTAKLYAEIFRSYSNALKSYDENLLIGGPASSDLHLDFCETLIREGGPNLDFVSFHAYPVPVSAKTNSQKFSSIENVREPIKKIKGWINKYQPMRSNNIKIGISEWNMKVLEDVDTASLINTLWSACWLGTLYEEGIDFANQWDLSTEKNAGGHSMFNVDKDGFYYPKSIYWAMWIWKNLMGDKLITSKIIPKNNNDNDLFCYSTKCNDSYQIMLVNSSKDKVIDVSLKLPKSIKSRKHLNGYTFSNGEYFWNPFTHSVHWSNPPTSIKLNNANKIRLDPSSITIINFAEQSNEPSIINDHLNPNDVKLEIILPEKLAQNRTINGYVSAYVKLVGRKLPYKGELNAILEIGSGDSIKKKNLKFKNGLSEFSYISEGEDDVYVKCYNAHSEDEHMIELYKQKLHSKVEWSFDDPLETWGANSTFKLEKLTQLKPNQSVAATMLVNNQPRENEDILFHFEPIDTRVSHDNKINGVFGEISASDDFICSDKDAAIQIIFQSNNDHWIPMGSIQLSDIRDGWKSFRFASSSLQTDKKLSEVYSLRFRLNSRSKFTGNIYLNDLGFIYKLDED